MFIQLFISSLVVILVLTAVGQAIYSAANKAAKK